MAISDFIEPAIKDYAKQATDTYSEPIDTSKYNGRQFVAGEAPVHTKAINMAHTGVGSYTSFISTPQHAQHQANGTVAGLGALKGHQDQTRRGGIKEDVGVKITKKVN